MTIQLKATLPGQNVNYSEVLSQNGAEELYAAFFQIRFSKWFAINHGQLHFPRPSRHFSHVEIDTNDITRKSHVLFLLLLFTVHTQNTHEEPRVNRFQLKLTNASYALKK